MKDLIFEDLIVFEIANNHWGSLSRALKIVETYGALAKKYNVKACMKLQLRNMPDFVHKDFRGSQSRYIKKIEETSLDKLDYLIIGKHIREAGMLLGASCFDEDSVDFASHGLNVDIIKIASADIDDQTLIKRILTKRKPTIVSTGGSRYGDLMKIAGQFEFAKIPLAINHCISIYPTKPEELKLNQIDWFVKQFPHNVIGFSTHEHYGASNLATAIAYGKGARTFERHIDISNGDIGKTSATYNIMPSEAEAWLVAFCDAKTLCGADAFKNAKREFSQVESDYLLDTKRGLYAKRQIEPMEELNESNAYLAVPVHYSNQLHSGNYSHDTLTVSRTIFKDNPIMQQDVLFTRNVSFG